MDAWWEKESLIKFESSTSIFIVAPSGGGKTELTKELLKHADGMFKVPPSKIYFCYSMWQNIYSEMQNDVNNIQFYQGFPSMDDLMIKGVDSEELIHMMCEGSHHSNFTVIFFLLQNVFQKGKSMRTASLNCHYFLLFDSKRDPSQIAILGRQIFPGNSKYFLDAYQKAIALKPFNFLLVDLSPRSDKSYQLRTNILPGQDTIVYQPAK